MIVVVDDRVTNRNILMRLAGSLDGVADVRAFADPMAALAFIEGQAPELVVTDYRMPLMNGDVFVQRCRALLPHVPIIVVTAYEDRQYRYRALEAGATDFLLSPIDQHEFRTRAANLLTMERQRRLIEGRAASLESDLVDVTREKARMLRASEQRLRNVIDAVPALICAYDDKGSCIFTNSYIASLLDISAVTAVGRTAGDLFGRDYAERHDRLDRLARRSRRMIRAVEETIRDTVGRERDFLTTKVPLVTEDGGVESVVTVSLDVTERKSYEQRLLHQATHDVVTDLPNRVLALERLTEGMAHARSTGRYVALLLIDLDHFKIVNDTLGHSAGDRLLVDVGARLAGSVEPCTTVARFGGDEFLIVLPNLADVRTAERAASRVIDVLAEPFVVAGREFHVSASIGVTMFPEHGETPEELLRKADAAMYRAKGEGRAAYSVFTRDLGERAVERMEMERRLRHAMQRGELAVHYQPMIAVADGRVVGAEALLRWFSPDLGAVSPTVFVSLAEEIGIIGEIGDWVLHEACRQAAEWAALCGRPLRVSVNVSARQFHGTGLVRSVESALAASGLAPPLLDLEITERLLLGDTRHAGTVLRALRALGVGLAIDDFGTGFASIVYLKRFPFSVLKLDREFVCDIDNDPTSAALAAAIITMARCLRLEVVGEGVETEAQLAILRREGCDHWQGFHASPALAPDDLLTFLQRWP